MPALLGADLEEAIKTEITHHRPNAPRAGSDAKLVSAPGDQVHLQRDGGGPFQPPGLSQRPHPVLDPRERIGLAARVEDDQGHRDLVQVELMDQPVTRLPGEIPQQHLSGLRAPARNLHLLGIKRPDVTPMGRVGRLGTAAR